MATTDSEQLPAGDIQPNGASRYHARILWALAILGGGVLWLRPIASSFWMDELVTWWTIKDSLSETIRRSLTYQGTSPLYYVISWGVSQVGKSEWILRLPSLAAACVAVYLMYRLALRLLDREFARLTVVAFVVWPAISFEASNARPYSIAIMLAVGSWLALVRWLDEGRRSDVALYIVCAALVIYTHYLFALVVPAQLLYALVRAREGSAAVRSRSIWLTMAAIAALSLPTVAQLVSLFGRSASLTIPGEVSVGWLSDLLMPAAAIGALVLGGALAWLSDSVSLRLPPVRRSAVVLVLSWLLLPLLVLGTISLVTPLRFLTARYTLSAAPAACLLLAGCFRAIGPASARRIVVFVFVILSVLQLAGPFKAKEDWRWAAAEAQSMQSGRTVVLIHPALVESSQLAWFADPERNSYLLNPTSYYDFPDNIIGVPYVVNDESEAYLGAQLNAVLPMVDTVVFVTRFPVVPYRAWLEGRLGELGWEVAQVESRGSMVVVQFVRSSGPLA
jgi:uncharacterized membrane protein